MGDSAVGAVDLAAAARPADGEQMINLKRLAMHAFVTPSRVKRAFPSATLGAIEAAIKSSEAMHSGQIRFVVEAALDFGPLFRGLSARQRAIEVFSQLGIWDTEHNNGVLIYLLLAERNVEIVADRALHSRVGSEGWERICADMEAAFTQGDFEGGSLRGLSAIGQLLIRHFPETGAGSNELPDTPVLI